MYTAVGNETYDKNCIICSRFFTISLTENKAKPYAAEPFVYFFTGHTFKVTVGDIL